MTNFMNLSTKDLEDLENQTAKILKISGEYILKHWHEAHKLSFKNKRDMASEIDVEVENLLRQELAKLLPEAGFIVEEGKSEKAKVYNWTIDPIDGTKYYVNDAPLFLTQIALVKNDKPILGQVYNPTSQQFFSASLGNGAFLNGNKLIDRTRQNLDEAIVDINFGGNDDQLDAKLKAFSTISRVTYRVRVTGSFLFIYLVTGAIDACINLNKGVKIVDLAPGMIIMQEAGLSVVEVNFSGLNGLIVSNKKLIESLKKILLAS